jgi:adenosylcobinamide kinase/adenosylcobinamide-phosphate guanylyltransferase
VKITLLGTGASDGWPNPWCDCASCAWARTHEVRAQTAVLVDDVLLVDCGPDAPRSAARFGLSLAGLRHLVVGHAHRDHLGPEVLMWRLWSTAAARRLDVVAPPAALAVCRAFPARRVGGDPGGEANGELPPLRLVEAHPGELVRLGDHDDRDHDDHGDRDHGESGPAAGGRDARGGPRPGRRGYEIRPVPASHGDASIGPAVLLDVTGPDGARLLYACDTGAPLPAAAREALAGRAFDVVLMEENNGDRPGFGEHLDLASFASVLAELRRRGAVVAATRVVAVHLSHRNPPGDVLARRLELMGAELLPDGAVIDTKSGTTTRLVPVGFPATAPTRAEIPGPAGTEPTAGPGRASPLYGTGPGERPAGGGPARPRRVLITGGSRSGKSAEAERRLAAEPAVVYVATAGPSPTGDDEWTARIAAHRLRRPAEWQTVETTELAPLLRADGPPLLVDCVSLWLTAHLDDPALAEHAAELVDAWRDTPRRVVAVTNEVGSGVVPATALGRRFRDELGRLNAALAAEADEVWHMVAGIPTRLPHGLPRLTSTADVNNAAE